MHRHAFDGTKGTVEKLEHHSDILKGNPWRDPSTRSFDVYTPPHYDARRSEPYPLLIDLVGYTSAGPAHAAYKAMSENVPERLDRLFAENRVGEGAVVVFPDCFTRLGGNQYINSPSVGLYADYLINEIVPFVESKFQAGGQRERRGVFGKSSGGYGALYHAMHYSDFWGAAVSHSGDMGFEFVYKSDFPNLLNELQKSNYNIHDFINQYWSKRKPTYQAGMALMLICMAATYDGNDENPLGFQLPFEDLHLGILDEDAWRRWLSYDPIHMVDHHVESLKKMKLLFIDVGMKDQYHIHYGTRQFVTKLNRYNINHFFEEFDDDHSGIDYRMDISLPKLIEALS